MVRTSSVLYKNKYYRPSVLIPQNEDRTANLVAKINLLREQGKVKDAERLEHIHFSITAKERR